MRSPSTLSSGVQVRQPTRYYSVEDSTGRFSLCENDQSRHSGVSPHTTSVPVTVGERSSTHEIDTSLVGYQRTFSLSLRGNVDALILQVLDDLLLQLIERAR